LRWDGPAVRTACRLLAIAGMILVALSAVPLPYWCYALWAVAVLGWLIVSGSEALSMRKRLKVCAGTIAVAACLAAGCFEITWRRMPTLPSGRWSELAVIGDSLSSGMMEPGETTWPQILRETHGVSVFDASHVGATARSAVRQAERIPGGETLVLVEIGGNDILGTTSAWQFAEDLSLLLSTLDRPDREVVMLELPLPPFFNEYGRIQRDLAVRHRVALVPRREFTRVLAARGATLDGLHLSPEGHRLMADMVWKCLGDALKTESSKSERPAPQ
jgi:acyl-CoA thioesterase-1